MRCCVGTAISGMVELRDHNDMLMPRWSLPPILDEGMEVVQQLAPDAHASNKTSCAKLVQHHCVVSLGGVTVWYHCKVSLYGITVWHLKRSAAGQGGCTAS